MKAKYYTEWDGIGFENLRDIRCKYSGSLPKDLQEMDGCPILKDNEKPGEDWVRFLRIKNGKARICKK